MNSTEFDVMIKISESLSTSKTQQGLQKNENNMALKGYDDRKEVILPKIVPSQ